MALTKRQELFVHEYVRTLNATQSAIAAGYSQKTAHSIGQENLHKPEIATEIETRLAVIKKRREQRSCGVAITKERFLDEVAAVGFSDITDVFSPNAQGKLVMSLADIKERGLGRLIRKMKVLPSGQIEFELHSKLPALELLAKAHDWIKDQVHHSGSVAVQAVDQEQRRRMYADPKWSEMSREMALYEAGLITQPKKEPHTGSGGESNGQVP